MTRFSARPEFQKECKQLGRKYKSLAGDLRVFRGVISHVPLGNGKHFNVIAQVEGLYIVKARLFCRYLKGASLRVVYAYHERERQIEFMELYAKGNKAGENRERIKAYLKSRA